MQTKTTAEKVDASKLLAMNALHAETAQNLASAYDRLEVKGLQVNAKTQATAKMAFVHGMLGSAFVRSPAVKEASIQAKFNTLASDKTADDIEAEMAQVVEKVMAIVALVINEFQSEIAGMNDVMAIVKGLEASFFEGKEVPASFNEVRELLMNCFEARLGR